MSEDFKTGFLIECTRMYQLDFQDFSELAIKSFLSSPRWSISKNNSLRFWVAMVTMQQVAENWPKMDQNEVKFTTSMDISLNLWYEIH